MGFCINSIYVKNMVNKLAVEFGPLRHIEMQIFKSALTIPLLLLIRNLLARAHIHTTHQHVLKIFVKKTFVFLHLFGASIYPGCDQSRHVSLQNVKDYLLYRAQKKNEREGFKLQSIKIKAFCCFQLRLSKPQLLFNSKQCYRID